MQSQRESDSLNKCLVSDGDDRYGAGYAGSRKCHAREEGERKRNVVEISLSQRSRRVSRDVRIALSVYTCWMRGGTCNSLLRLDLAKMVYPGLRRVCIIHTALASGSRCSCHTRASSADDLLEAAACRLQLHRGGIYVHHLARSGLVEGIEDCKYHCA